MSTMTAPTAHIRLDEMGVARVDDTNTEVVDIITDWLAHGSSPAEIHFQFPHLSLAQIHAAFSYYYDHKEEIDREIEEDDREFEEGRRRMMAEMGSSHPLARVLASRQAS